ncbi:MAG: hypothetical protein CV087_23295 [Candidatus Brocadia sp. WS118]|nr:MAG: hypothetical protein CV087_23295 [Candidatus Brocadia sp. WS118]
MPSVRSPVRVDKIVEAMDFLKAMQLEDATADAKLFFLFQKRESLEEGLSLKEIAIINRPTKLYKDEKTNEIKPWPESLAQAKQEVCNFRKNMKNHSIILYCMIHPDDRHALYFNIPTKKLYETVSRNIDKIIQGMNHNKEDVLKLFTLTKKQRNRIAKLHADEQRKEIMKKIIAQLSKKRREEIEALTSTAETEEQSKEQTEQ